MAYRDVILADAPVSYYRLSEALGATTATDELGTNNGTYVNTPTQGVAGALVNEADTATLFTRAQSEYVLCKTGNIVGGLTNWTIELWLNSIHAGPDALYCERHASAGAAIVRITLESGGKWKLTYTDSGGVSNSFTTAAPSANINDGVWHHIVVTKAGTAVVGYQDGGQVGAVTLTAGNGMTANMDCRIGSDALDAAVFLDGTEDEVALYSSALSATQVGVHYRAARMVDVYKPHAMPKGV